MPMDLLIAGAGSLGLTLGPRHLSMFETYYRELSAWNQRFNLTAITAYEHVQVRHFLDSLSCLLALPRADLDQTVPSVVPLQMDAEPLWLIDVGSGAGFPGLPLKIMLPEAKVTLVESVGKKVAFLKHMIDILELDRVDVLAMRAEEAGHLPEHRERYDLVVARAVSKLPILAEYCLPFCRVGGRMVAPKGDELEDEIEAAQTAIRLLGGSSVTVKPVTIPHLDGRRHLVVILKGSTMPDRYPRRVGVPAKRPLS